MSETTGTTGLRELVAEVLGLDPAELAEESGPHDTGAWTSLKHLQLVVTLEETYGISLSTRDIKALRSVATVREVLAGRGVTA